MFNSNTDQVFLIIFKSRYDNNINHLKANGNFTYHFYCYVSYVFLLLYMLRYVYSVFIVPTGNLRLP